LLDGGGTRFYFEREKRAFFFTGKKQEPAETMQQEEPGNRRNIPFIADGRRGQTDGISWTAGADQRKRQRGSPCRSAANLEKMKLPLPDQTGRISDTGKPCRAKSAKVLPNEGDTLRGGVYMPPALLLPLLPPLCNPPAGSGPGGAGQNLCRDHGGRPSSPAVYIFAISKGRAAAGGGAFFLQA
jgi:hypothetical protein